MLIEQLFWVFLMVPKLGLYLHALNETHTCWSRWGHKSCLFLCHSCDIRAPPGIQTQQLGLNVDSLETTENSCGRSSVCQSRCVHGDQVNTAANCQVKLKPRRVMFQCHQKANLARLQMPNVHFCWHKSVRLTFV